MGNRRRSSQSVASRKRALVLQQLEERTVPSASLDFYDRGDFYRVNGERANLLRRDDAIAVRADSLASAAALTTTGSPFAGYEVSKTFDAHTFLLTCPPSQEVGPNIAISSEDDPRFKL